VSSSRLVRGRARRCRTRVAYDGTLPTSEWTARDLAAPIAVLAGVPGSHLLPTTTNPINDGTARHLHSWSPRFPISCVAEAWQTLPRRAAIVAEAGIRVAHEIGAARFERPPRMARSAESHPWSSSTSPTAAPVGVGVIMLPVTHAARCSSSTSMTCSPKPAAPV